MTEQLSTISSDTQCPECGGQLVTESEVFCRECNLVLEVDVIDRGPEWRYFPEDGDSQDPRRTGGPQTVQYHDGGLSTTIGHSGDWKQITGAKRRRLSRQQAFHKRAKFRSKLERNLADGLGETQRIASRMELTESVTNRACALFRDVQQAELTTGRSIDTLAAACVYVASRRARVLRTAEDIAEVSSCSVRSLQRRRFVIQQELDVAVPLVTATDHLSSIIGDLPRELTTEERQAAQDLALEAEQSAHVHGSPTGIAAAVVQAVVGKHGDCSQLALADAADVAPQTVRGHHTSLVEAPDVSAEGGS